MGGLFSSIASAITAPIAAIGSAGLSLIGGLVTNSTNASNIGQQENFQAEEADTTYQRTMADMSAAGLNPILAYQSQDPMPMGGVPAVQNVIGNAVNSGMDAYSTMTSAGLTSNQAAVAGNQADISGSEGEMMGIVNDVLDDVLGRPHTLHHSAKSIGDAPSNNPPPLPGNSSVDPADNYFNPGDS